MRQATRSRGLWGPLLLALCLAAAPRAAANMSRLDYDPSLNGQILPRRETTVQVVSETLEIRFEHGGPPYHRRYGFAGVAPRAFVTARYTLRNPSTRPVVLDLAFPVVAGALRDDLESKARSGGLRERVRYRAMLAGEPKGVRFQVSVDGQGIPHQSVPFETLIAKRADAWRRAILDWMPTDDFIAALPRKHETTEKNQAELRKHLAERKGLAPGVAAVLASRLLPHPYRKLSRLENWRDGFVCYAYHTLFPQARTPIAEAFRQWRVDGRWVDPYSGELCDPHRRSAHTSNIFLWAGLWRRISFATFRVTLPPGAQRQVEVAYDHLVLAVRTRRRHENLPDHEFQFQYILRTADHWASFGPIALRVLVPQHLKAAFSLPLKYEGPRDGYMVFTARLERPDTNLLVGMAQGLKNHPRPEWGALSQCVGWLRQYQEAPRGPWADDYLLRHAESVRGLWDARGSERARREDWALILKSSPEELLRRIATQFPHSNGGHRAAWMLIERALHSPDGLHPHIEREVEKLIGRPPAGCVGANARYLLALCRMRDGEPGAVEAFEAAAAAPAHWRVREQAKWFADVLRRAKAADAPLLKDWAECELRSALRVGGRRPWWERRRSTCPVNLPVAPADVERLYCTHWQRTLAYPLLKRMALQLEWRSRRRRRHRDLLDAWRQALAELYWRAEKGETTPAALQQVRSQALDALRRIGVGHTRDVVRHARNSEDPQLRRLAGAIRFPPAGI